MQDMYVVKFREDGRDSWVTVHDRYFTFTQAKAFIDGIAYTNAGRRISYESMATFNLGVPSMLDALSWAGTDDAVLRIGDKVWAICRVRSSYLTD